MSRSRDRRAFTGSGGGLLAPVQSKKKTIKISSRTVAVRVEPNKYADILCQLQCNIYVQSNDEKVVEGVAWLQTPCGWVCSMDNNGFLCYTLSNDVEANKAWAAEFDARRRIAGAITALLTRSHSLPNARRVSRAILNHIQGPTARPLVNVPDVSLEDLVVGLAASTGLRQAEVLEFMRITASKQCNPVKALKDIATDVNDLISMRPTLWIKSDLSVLETMDIKSKNDRFVMAAARGDMVLFEKFLAMGQELAALHSDLKYTAIHAAADFGQEDMVKRMISTGISLNIRDARKGQTPLHFAGQSGRSAIAQLLLAAGADKAIPNYKGLLAYEIADDQGNFETREILKYTPPEIQFVSVISTTTQSISIKWDPPIVHEHMHAHVLSYVVEWTPVGNFIKVGHGDRFSTNRLTHKVKNLLPCTGHAFAIYSVSAAGWSVPSSKLIHFTLPAPPDAPPAMEMLKIGVNGILLAWHHPKNDNGALVNMFQIELIDFEMGERVKEREEVEMRRREKQQKKKEREDDIEMMGLLSLDEQQQQQEGEDDVDYFSGEEEDEESTLLGGASLDSLSKASRAHTQGEDPTVVSSIKDAGSIADSKMPRKSSSGNESMMHRIFKHKNMNIRKKLCMGLEPNRPYQCRIRCKNDLGYSAWSEWIGPVTPQYGVYVLDFDREKRSVRVGWFKPILSNGRKVTNFELQLCMVTGPMEKSVRVYQKDDEAANALANANAGFVYHTLRNDLKHNEYVIENLRAGARYQVRVRAEIDGTWCDWTINFFSDIILMPSCAPEAPFGMRVSEKVVSDFAFAVPGKTQSQEEAIAAIDAAAALAAAAEAAAVAAAEAAAAAAIAASEEKARAKAEAELNWRAGMDEGRREEQEEKAQVNEEEEKEEETGGIGGGEEIEKEEEEDVEEGVEIDKRLSLDISHDSILLQWQNGINNGSPCIEYQIVGAKVLDYRQAASQEAKAAALAAILEEDEDGKVFEFQDGDEAHDAEIKMDETAAAFAAAEAAAKVAAQSFAGYAITGMSSFSAASSSFSAPHQQPLQQQQELAQGQGQGVDESENEREEEVEDESDGGAIKWKNMTRTGELLGPQAFRALQLTQGCTYIFRVRQRNEHGWSPFSKASEMITTFACRPPSTPVVVSCSSYFVFLQWSTNTHAHDASSSNKEQEALGLTYLDFEVQIGKVPLGETPTGGSVKWLVATTRPAPQLCDDVPVHDVDDQENEYKQGQKQHRTGVMIDCLSSSTAYTARVRVRTVAGWSSWTDSTPAFKTLSS